MLCVSILFCGNVFASGEDVDISKPTGYILNSAGEIVPYINKQSTVTLTDKSYVTAESNTPFFKETVKVTINALSSNVSKVMIRVRYHYYTVFEIIESSELSNGGTFSFDIPAQNQYFVDVKVVSGNVSASSPGTVTLTVPDK